MQQYKIMNGTKLLGTTTDKTYKVSNLAPLTKYTFTVTPNNGLRDGTAASLTLTTRGIRFNIPVTLTVGAAITLQYQEYSLGLVPIGTEPDGFFGGGNEKNLAAKVVSSSGGSSVVELTTGDANFTDGTALTKQSDGYYAAFNGYKAVYYK